MGNVSSGNTSSLSCISHLNLGPLKLSPFARTSPAFGGAGATKNASLATLAVVDLPGRDSSWECGLDFGQVNLGSSGLVTENTLQGAAHLVGGIGFENHVSNPHLQGALFIFVADKA